MTDPLDVRLEEYAGPHGDLIDSFREAEDSETLLEAYLDLGRVWVARSGARIPARSAGPAPRTRARISTLPSTAALLWSR